MHKTPPKNDLTNNELAEVLISKIETTYQVLDKKIDLVREEADQNVNRLATIMMDKFDKVDERFERIDSTMATKEDMDNRFDNLENKMDRRMLVTEDRVRVIKNIIEKDLGAQVAW